MPRVTFKRIDTTHIWLAFLIIPHIFKVRKQIIYRTVFIGILTIHQNIPVIILILRIASKKIWKCISSTYYVAGLIRYQILVMKPAHWTPWCQRINLIIYLNTCTRTCRKRLKIWIALHAKKTRYPINNNIYRNTSVSSIYKCSKNNLSTLIRPEVKCWQYNLRLGITYHLYPLKKCIPIIFYNTRPFRLGSCFPYTIDSQLLLIFLRQHRLSVICNKRAGNDCNNQNNYCK